MIIAVCISNGYKKKSTLESSISIEAWIDEIIYNAAKPESQAKRGAVIVIWGELFFTG